MLTIETLPSVSERSGALSRSAAEAAPLVLLQESEAEEQQPLAVMQREGPDFCST